jgi:hypothetical protein
VVSAAFANWVTTQLFDSTKSPAANTAEAAKQIKFNARALWERYQREVAREVQVADEAQQRGQTYLPPAALLPRTDQPTNEQTHAAIDRLTQAQAVALPATGLPQLPAVTEPEISIEEYAAATDKADIMERMRRIGGLGASRQTRSPEQPALNEPLIPVEIRASMTVFTASEPLESPPPLPVKPLSMTLLPEIIHRRKMLETQYRRQKPPYDLAIAAKYLVWSEQGNEEMKTEAIDWLSVHRGSLPDKPI